MVFLLTLRLYHLDVPPLENKESWRQADTESIARNFVQYDFNLLSPNFNYDGPLPNVPALELQVTTLIIAVLYQVFGFHYFLARLVPICFYLVSAGYLYCYARKQMGFEKALFSLLIYGILPVNVYFSRAIMPEAAGLMFLLGGFFYFDKWIDKPVGKGLALSSIFLALALMTKPPTAFIAVPMVYLCWKRFGWSFLKNRELWVFTLFICSVAGGYYIYSNSTAEFHFALSITEGLVLRRIGSAFYSREAWDFFRLEIPGTMTRHVLYLLPLGMITAWKKDKTIIFWFLGMAAEAIFIVSTIRSSYYLIFLTPPIALLAGSFLGRLAEKRVLLPVSFLILLLIGYSSFQELKPMYAVNTKMQEEVRLVQALTSAEDLLVVGSLDPCVLSLSGRRGWRLYTGNDHRASEDLREELDLYIRSGANYFIPIQGKVYGDEDGSFLEYVVQTYEKIEPVKGYPIFRLNRPAQSSAMKGVLR